MRVAVQLACSDITPGAQRWVLSLKQHLGAFVLRVEMGTGGDDSTKIIYRLKFQEWHIEYD